MPENHSHWQFLSRFDGAFAAETGEERGAMAGAVAVSDGVWMFQVTGKGLAVEISGTGTKYYKVDDLN